jgi:hypothetical protein
VPVGPSCNASTTTGRNPVVGARDLVDPGKPALRNSSTPVRSEPSRPVRRSWLVNAAAPLPDTVSVVKTPRGNVAVPAKPVQLSQAETEAAEDATAAASEHADALAAGQAPEKPAAVAERVAKATGWKVTPLVLGLVATKDGYAPIGVCCSTPEESAAKLLSILTAPGFVPMRRTASPVTVELPTVG